MMYIIQYEKHIICPFKLMKKYVYLKIQKKGFPKKSPKQQNRKCCMLGFIEPVYGR